MRSAKTPVHVIGAGLAGSEAAWQLAEAGVPVVLHEMRPALMTPAHQTGGFAELVCSNSFRSDDSETNAVGLLHAEMRRAGSLVMRMGDAHKLPAGGALAVDRVAFSEAVTAALRAHPLVRFELATTGQEITRLPIAWSMLHYLIAAGFALGSAAVAGYLPARRAARLNPVDIISGAT